MDEATLYAIFIGGPADGHGGPLPESQISDEIDVSAIKSRETGEIHQLNPPAQYTLARVLATTVIYWSDPDEPTDTLIEAALLRIKETGPFKYVFDTANR